MLGLIIIIFVLGFCFGNIFQIMIRDYFDD